MVSDPDKPVKDGEVLDSEAAQEKKTVDILAHIGDHYTERPDLLIKSLEEFDPGFVKRMNAAAEESAKAYRASRFAFGKNQAYVSLLIQVIAALAVLFMTGLMVIYNTINFFHIMGFAAFYAVTQGGRSGFLEIAKAVARKLGSNNSKGD